MSDQANIIPFRGGKQRRTDEPASARLWIRLTPDERAVVDRVAAENNTNVSDLLRLAILTLVADYDDGDLGVFRQWRRVSKDNAAA